MITDTDLIEQMLEERAYKGYFMEDEEKLDVEFRNFSIQYKGGLITGDST